MAIRTIVKKGDDILTKKCRPVTEFNEKLWTLLDDMKETLLNEGGAGLAAPQVGILRRIFIMDVDEDREIVEVINPEFVKCEGEQQNVEGCLSAPGEYGITKRPEFVKIKAQNRFGKKIVISGNGLKARCICHESDHLDGKMFFDSTVRMLTPEELEQLENPEN